MKPATLMDHSKNNKNTNVTMAGTSDISGNTTANAAVMMRSQPNNAVMVAVKRSPKTPTSSAN